MQARRDGGALLRDDPGAHPIVGPRPCGKPGAFPQPWRQPGPARGVDRREKAQDQIGDEGCAGDRGRVDLHLSAVAMPTP
jgi:hypothetical protein